MAAQPPIRDEEMASDIEKPEDLISQSGWCETGSKLPSGGTEDN